VSVDATVLTSREQPGLLPFNPFTETPELGKHYRLGPSFGKPVSAADYQPSRAFQLAVGLRY